METFDGPLGRFSLGGFCDRLRSLLVDSVDVKTEGTKLDRNASSGRGNGFTD